MRKKSRRVGAVRKIRKALNSKHSTLNEINEKIHFISRMLAYAGIFVNECAEELVADKIVLHFCMKFLAFSFSAGSAEQVSF